MSVQGTPPAKGPRRPLLIVLGACGALILIACVIGAAVAGFFYLRRNQAAAGQPTVAYILDTSPRMNEPAEGGTRLAIAQSVLSEIVRPASPDVSAGLRVFGSGAVDVSCEDTQLLVPFAQANQSAIADELVGLKAGPSSDSALAQAMIAAIRDLSSTGGPHSLVVVTGGSDSCNPESGALIAQEAERAGIDLRTYVIGFQVPQEEAQAIKSMVEDAPGASYLPASNEDTLRAFLTSIQHDIDGPSQSTTTFQPETACDHPYFPLRQGATWSYSGSGFSYTWIVTGVSGDLSNASASVAMDFEGGSFVYDWTCSGDGVQFFELANMSLEQLGSFEFSMTSQSGSPLLPGDQFQPGASWTSSYTQTLTGAVEGISVDFTAVVDESHTAGDRQTLTTGLGTFDVIPVHTTSTVSSTSDFGSFTTTSESTIWYAEGVGIVRLESSSEGSTYTSELDNYFVP